MKSLSTKPVVDAADEGVRVCLTRFDFFLLKTLLALAFRFRNKRFKKIFFGKMYTRENHKRLKEESKVESFSRKIKDEERLQTFQRIKTLNGARKMKFSYGVFYCLRLFLRKFLTTKVRERYNR